MVTAVETLRQAALVADAAAMRQRMAARQRIEVLREALGIVQTVREPARALERGVARLSEGIDATIALITTADAALAADTRASPPTRFALGLAEMRDSAADLDATFAAAGAAQTEDRPEAEFVAHILAVRAQVDRRDAAVRGFVHAQFGGVARCRRDRRAVRAGVARSGQRSVRAHRGNRRGGGGDAGDDDAGPPAIVRDLPLEEAPMAA